MGLLTSRQFDVYDVAAKLVWCTTFTVTFDALIVRSVCIESVVYRVLAREERVHSLEEHENAGGLRLLNLTPLPCSSCFGCMHIGSMLSAN